MKPTRSQQAEIERTQISEAEVSRAWDENADSWAGQVRRGLDLCREHYNNPAFLDFIGDISGLSVLDAGCGEGYNTRILRRAAAAQLCGIDLSARMIELARLEERREPLGIRYETGSFTDLSTFAGAAFDLVVSFMAMMDGPDFDGAARAVFSVLKPGGVFAFSTTHPCFITKGCGWVRDDSGRETALTVANYFDSQPWVERWKFARAAANEGPPFAVPRFDRTLSDYINTLIDSGFIVRRIGEPRPSEQACRENPWLARWRQHAPLFLYIRAEKPR